MEYNFKKVHTGKDLAISFIIIAAGIGLFFLHKGIGITITACGIISLLVYKAGWRLEGKGDLLSKQSLNLCKQCKQSVTEFLIGKDIFPTLKQGSEGGTILLEVYFNKENSLAYAQLFDFCNYSYEPVTDPVELRGPKADKLIFQL